MNDAERLRASFAKAEAQGPEPTTEIGDLVSEIGEALCLLGAGMDKMEERVMPILGPAAPVVQETANDLIEAETELGKRLVDICLMLRGRVNRLRELESRVRL